MTVTASPTIAYADLLKIIHQWLKEQIDIEPAKLKVIEHVQAKYCCRACNNIKQAKLWRQHV